MVATIKRRALLASISWDTFLRFTRAKELLDVCTDLQELIIEIQANRGHFSSVDAHNMPTSLKLASDGGCQLRYKERTTAAKQLRKAGRPVNIPISESKFLV